MADHQVIKLKRASVAGNIPTLTDGELGLDHLSKPPKLWTKVPTTTDPSGLINLLSGEAVEVEDAPDDRVYGRANGDWVPIAPIGDAPPDDPLPGQLWFNSADVQLYIFYKVGTDPGTWVVATHPPAPPE